MTTRTETGSGVVPGDEPGGQEGGSGRSRLRGQLTGQPSGRLNGELTSQPRSQPRSEPRSQPSGRHRSETSTRPGNRTRARPGRRMVWVPGGTFAMGSDDFYPEERPVRTVEVAGFWMDEHPVTVAEYRRFVRATGYVTVAERHLDAGRASGSASGVDPRPATPGSLVFRPTPGPVDLSDWGSWWSYVPGACWRRPEGPVSAPHGRERHPVTHVAYEDAEAYAAWSGKQLPTETEWEYAARGGLDGAVYAWGNDFSPRGRLMANVWQGDFPWRRAGLGPYRRTSPTGLFPANGYGLLDMTGNVWEWTSDLYHAPEPDRAAKAVCVPVPLVVPLDRSGPLPRQRAATDDPSGTELPADGSYDVDRVVRVVKGGSYLCSATFCLRYRPAARQPSDSVTATCHVGFRCVVHPR
ncbi:Formylglycine-generating enzyme, required for sulfatase activity, contains SUMF1/FGE domain [Actinopolymorpha cephalotaxi]|uniref:Formylglycine-generating enzyme required for sulfatase activity n=1 Tax=Actinopolymorpha cephalotaxi TaxID=504797 RepID=A0A1I2KXE9_9ACTN|nr:formylglycine-generating enzyme family protein [Actinopolymorpha cephalotaxi]NYH84702.1 formylglycine-generating enzyme required for sulfatase activity [Actinopolymorpha cephalotaxi]SFF70989.1 Formylglycine-generating enzyme, required for sulfatase activity, contains SUMF1/FGE domain [Actinopolymorpha cephalotaxi]